MRKLCSTWRGSPCEEVWLALRGGAPFPAFWGKAGKESSVHNARCLPARLPGFLRGCEPRARAVAHAESHLVTGVVQAASGLAPLLPEELGSAGWLRQLACLHSQKTLLFAQATPCGAEFSQGGCCNNYVKTRKLDVKVR